MKKFNKTCIKIGILLVLLMMMPAAAFAAGADTAIGVQLDGDDVAFTDAAPLNENGRVYVPFRAVFEALDAAVDFNAETGMIMAEKDNTKVTFQVDQNTVTVNNDQISIDAAPFIRDGRTYVPVRFAAQTLGMEVGWDGNEQTVVMLDKATLKEAAKGQYTLMDKYMKYMESQKLTSTVKSVGDLQFEMKLSSDETVIPVAGTMKLNGISNAEIADMKLAMELNMDAFQAALEEGEALAEDDLAALNALKHWDMQVITDSRTGKAYMKSDIFAMTGMNGSTWYKIDMNNSGMELQNLLQSEAAAAGSYEKAVLNMIDSLTADNAAMCDLMLAIMDMYRDDSFQQVGSSSLSSMRFNLGASELGDLAMSMSITLKNNGAAVTGCQQATTLYMGSTPVMTMKNDQNGRKATVDFDINLADVISMKVDGTCTYTTTNEKPQTAPPAGAVVLDMTSQTTI